MVSRTLVMLAGGLAASGCGPSNEQASIPRPAASESRQQPTQSAAAPVSQATCAQLLIGEWNIEGVEGAAPIRGTPGAISYAAMDRIAFTTNQVRLLGADAPVAFGDYQVVSSSLTEAQLGGLRPEPFTVQCPDPERLVLSDLLVPGRFSYRRSK